MADRSESEISGGGRSPLNGQIKIEVVQPKIEVDLGEDYWAVNGKIPDEAHGSQLQHQVPSNVLTSDDSTEKTFEDDDYDSKSQLAFLFRQDHLCCPQCGKYFRDNFSLDEHITYCVSNEKNGKYDCSLCSYTTDRKANLTRHIGRAHDGDEYRAVCSGCDKSFKHNQSLKQHMTYCEQLNDEIVKHKCKLCDFKTKRKLHLSRHLKLVHFPGTEDRQTCPGCEKSLKNLVSLKQHMTYCDKLNDKVTKYKCQHCNFETKWKMPLERHIRTVHSSGTATRLTCPQCKKSYKNSDSLRKHMSYCEKSKREILKFKCSHCRRETKRKDSLRRHIRMVHPIEVIERSSCPLCGQSYKQQDSLKQHMKKYCKANVLVKQE